METTRQAVGSGPDLVVSAVSGPASAQPGQQITALVTVCNQGTQAASAPVEVYLSQDTTITPNLPSAPSPDFGLGVVFTPNLSPGQCQSLTLQGSAYAPTEGAYYLGAIVDPQNGLPELSETNNSKAGSRIGIGNKPDFIVSSVTGPASARLGQQFAALVTVCNQGTQGGTAAVEAYLSQDTTITPNSPSSPSPDFSLGAVSTVTLNPGQCQTLTLQGSAFVPTPGAYYLGAVVDPPGALPELIKDNNGTAGSLIIIGA